MRNEAQRMTVSEILDEAKQLKVERDKIRDMIKKLFEQFVPAFIKQINDLKASATPLATQRKILLVDYQAFSRDCGFPDARMEKTGAFDALVARLREICAEGVVCGHDFKRFDADDCTNLCVICGKEIMD